MKYVIVECIEIFIINKDDFFPNDANGIYDLQNSNDELFELASKTFQLFADSNQYR